MINRTSLKFIGIFIVIIAAVFLALYLLSYFNSPERKAERYFADLEKQYAEDFYGGKTPEETLQLFIDALKAGDIELASKYFVVDKQEEQLKFLIKVRDVGNKDLLIQELSYPYKKRDFGTAGSRAIFDIYNGNDNTNIQVDIAKGPNGIWKIVDM